MQARMSFLSVYPPPSSCPMNHLHAAETTLGFMLGLLHDGILAVSPADRQALTISRPATHIAQCLKRTISEVNIPHCDETSRNGYR